MPDTAIFFAVAVAPPSGYTLAPLWSLTDNSLRSWYTSLRFVDIVKWEMFLHHKTGYSPVVHMGKFVIHFVLQKSSILHFLLKSSNRHCIFFYKNSFIPWCKPTKTGRCSIKVAISRASSALCVHRAELVGDCIPKPQPPTPVSWKICLLCSLIFHSSA